jgi:8-oxo-dGTP pyrophosphatase MutT (NUDIX family)
MPNVYVFPGGRVEPGDATRIVTRRLPPAVARRLGRRASPARAQALAVAALRETWEETGLIFGERHGEDLRPDLSRLEYLGRAITPARNPIRYHARFLRARFEDAAGRLAGNGELLDLEWYPIEDARTLPIIDVTDSVLAELLARLRGRPPRDLFVRYRGAQRVLVLE